MQRHSFSLAVIVSLIALRVGIGTHFFREGLAKLRDPKPFSGAFFDNAKGPYADQYHNLVWDRDGLHRLDSKNAIQDWGHFRARVESHYGFDENQKKQAARIQKRTEDQLTEHLEANADDIYEYRQGLVRRDRYKADEQRMETPSLRDQVDKIESELRTKRTKLVAPIDLMWQGYIRDLNAIATHQQRPSGFVSLDKPGRRLLDSETIDLFIPWFDMTLGALLITGFATRFAAIAGAGFLCFVIVSQWPTSVGAVATWPQFIEMLGLLVVAATGAGRFLGLDGILGMVRSKSRSTATQPSAKKAVAT